MVGLAARGHSIRMVRTLIEITVLIAGFFMGGVVGIGTVLFAVTIGPIAHVTIPAFSHGVPQPNPLEDEVVEGGPEDEGDLEEPACASA